MPGNVKTVPLTPTPDKQWHAVPPVQLPPKTGDWLIVFQLKGDHAKNVAFDVSDPIWVRANAKPDQANKTHEQISALHVTGDGKELIVLDRNDNPETTPPLQLHYRLNFQGHGPLDPIIENGGGPNQVYGPPSGGSAFQLSTETIALALLAAVVLLLIGGLIGRALAK